MKMGFKNALASLLRSPGSKTAAAAPAAAMQATAAEPVAFEDQLGPEPDPSSGDAEDESVAGNEEEEDDRPETPPGIPAAGGMAAQVRHVTVFVCVCWSNRLCADFFSL